MSSRAFKTRGLNALKLLAMTCLVAGCVPTLTTQTAAIEADRVTAAQVCKVWVPITYSSRDTEQTQTEVRANNAARKAYCG